MRRPGLTMAIVALCILVGAIAVPAAGPAHAAAGSGGQAGSGDSKTATQQPSIPALIRTVAVTGNQQVAAQTILEAITRTQPGHMLREEDLQGDMQAIIDLGYFQHVSVDVQPVGPASATGSGSGASPAVPVRVIFRVQENPVLKALIVQPDARLKPLLEQAQRQAGSDKEGMGEALAKLTELPVGKVAHGPTIQRRLQELPGRVWERYGVGVAISTVELKPDGNLEVGLRPIRVAGIDVEGNQKTQAYVIRREIQVKPGDILQRDALQQSLRRVLMLQFFEEVNADLQPVPEEPAATRVVVRVKEQRTGNVMLGVTYSGNEGLMGFVEISDSNLFGRAQQVKLSLNAGAKAQRYEVSFTEPYLMGSPNSLSFSLAYQKIQKGDPAYWDQRYGGEVTLGRPIWPDTRGYVTFRNYQMAAPLVDDPTRTAEGAQTGLLRSIRLATRTDTSDHPFNPTRGYRLNLASEFAGLGGNFLFNKYEASASGYLPVHLFGGQQVLAARVSGGVVRSTGGNGAPVQEIFEVGGGETVRGYGFGETARGWTMGFANLEYRFPIYNPVSGVLFVDAGNAWQSPQEMDLRNLKVGTGFGVRIEVPVLGSIRLDYGMKREGSPQFHFSIGQAF